MEDLIRFFHGVRVDLIGLGLLVLPVGVGILYFLDCVIGFFQRSERKRISRRPGSRPGSYVSTYPPGSRRPRSHNPGYYVKERRKNHK